MPILPFLPGAASPQFPEGPVEKQADIRPDPIAVAKARVEQMLSQMQLPQAPPPVPLTTAQKILGPIADALSARATVMAGGVAPQEGAFARGQREAGETQRKAEVQAGQARANVSNELFLGEISRIQQQIDEMRKQRQEHAEKYDFEAFRQRMAAKIDAMQAAQQEIDDVNEWKRKEGLRLVAEGRLDASLDPTKLTVTQLQQAQANPAAIDRAAVQAAMGIPVQEGAKVSTVFEPGQAPRTTVTVENLKDMQQQLQGGRALTNGQRLAAARVGVQNVSKKTDEEIIDEAGEIMNKRTLKLPADAEQGLRASIEGLAQLNLMRQMMTRPDGTPDDIYGPASDVLGGAIGGFAGFPGTDIRKKRLAFGAKSGNQTDLFARSRTGAAFPQQEYDRLENLTPALGHMHDKNLANIRELEQWYNGRIAAISSLHKIPPERIQALREEVDRSMYQYIVPEDATFVGEIP